MDGFRLEEKTRCGGRVRKEAIRCTDIRSQPQGSFLSCCSKRLLQDKFAQTLIFIILSFNLSLCLKRVSANLTTRPLRQGRGGNGGCELVFYLVVLGKFFFVLEEKSQWASSDSPLVVTVTLRKPNSNEPRESSVKDQEPLL